ncbi:MAG: molybdopterin-dependent oxidoreductase [Thermoanaerobaculia bacterium]
MKIQLTVNGQTRSGEVEPRTLLVDFLRDDVGLTGTKHACETGECGACTVLCNGKSVKSCAMLAVQASGAEVITIEGVAQDGKLSPLQEAFWECHAVQNGYDTPGLIMSLTELLGRNPDPTDQEIRSWLDGSISRITGYQNVVAAVKLAAAKMRGEAKPEEPEPGPGGIFGASIKEKESPGLIRGDAKFVGDINLPNMAHAAIKYSDQAHARLLNVDTTAAAAMPGVIRVVTGKDVAHLMPLPVVWVPQDVKSNFPPHPSGIAPGGQHVLAQDRVRYIGEQIAVVVAETRQQALDAVDHIKVEYEPLPVVTDAEAALKDGAPQLHDTIPNNLLMHGPFGDKAVTEEAIAKSEVVIKQRFHNQRMMANTIETRGAVAQFDARTGDYTLWTNVQPLYPLRLLISQYVLGIPYTKLRIIAPAFGESQGSKGYLNADQPLMLYLAKELGRPVKWQDTRKGLARSTAHGRDQVEYVTLAGTKDGRLTALSCSAYSNVGAYPVINAPGQPRTLIGRSIPGSYVIPSSYYEVFIAYTNTVPVGPLRGSGRAEATFLIERMIDLYAREIGMDPADVRRRNMVQPDQFPYENGLGWTYDSGDYPAALDKALAKIDYANLAARKEEAKQRGKRLGVGIGSYVAVAGVGPSAKMGKEGLVSGTWGTAAMWVHPTGEVTVTTGAQPHGQGQETTFAQIVSKELGVPVGMVQVRHSDTAGALYYGQASYGSRTLSVEGTAVQIAAQKIKAKVIKLAAHLFKSPEEAIVYDAPAGKIFLTYAPEQAVITLQQAAFMLWLAWDLPEGMDPGLEVTAYFDPVNFNFPFGTHVALVEVDEKSGQVDLVRYATVDDFGNVVNPAVVDAQTHGNITLGIGQALLEQVVFDENGHIATDSFSKYAIPRASQLPVFETERMVTPSPSNPLGAKGAGDVSNPPVAPAIVNAVCDALKDLGVKHIEMPLTAEKVWRAMQQAKGTSTAAGFAAAAGENR